MYAVVPNESSAPDESVSATVSDPLTLPQPPTQPQQPAAAKQAELPLYCVWTDKVRQRLCVWEAVSHATLLIKAGNKTTGAAGPSAGSATHCVHKSCVQQL